MADYSMNQPEEQEVQELLGLYSQGRMEEAEQRAVALVSKYPDAPLLHNIFGAICTRQGKVELSAEAYRRAATLDPEFYQAHNNLGVALKALGRPAEAVDAYDQALKSNPDYAEAHNNLGAALRELNRHEDAIESYRRAIAADPKHADAHYNLANALRDLGRREEAAECYFAAIKVKPDFAEAYRGLSAVHKFTEGDPLLAAMKAHLPGKGRNDAARMNICFAMSKAHADSGETDQAFEFLAEGNALRKAQTGYNFEQDEALFEMLKAVFSGDLPPPPYAPSDRKPVFILGMPRSGTTLAEQILASHSEVYGAGELSALTRAVAPILVTAEQDISAPLHADAITAIRRAYLETIEALGAEERIITDKMPLNFRWIGYIATCFPDAKIVHLKRSPMAVCWSIYQQFFTSEGLGFAWDLADIGNYYRLYADLMDYWRDRFPGRIYDLDYEKLTENQEVETRALLDHCGLAFEEQCLQFHETDRVVKTASQFQVTQALYRGSSDAWREYETHLGPLKAALGEFAAS